MPTASPVTLILGSTSPYRRQLLERLGLPFEVRSPNLRETRLASESPRDTALRLAAAKAAAVAADAPDTLIIASDQVAELNGQILSKPGNHLAATAQLRAASGHQVSFHTGVCLLDSRSCRQQLHADHTRVHFRNLTDTEIDAYLRKDQPYDCAGSFKAESLGITLFDRIDNEDPTALIGLPMIWLANALRRAGLSPLK